MISRTGQYALRILGYLAERPTDWVLGKDIAGATGIPSNYLLKILNQLSKHSFVRSRKGWGGGFQLRGEVHDTPIRTVLGVIDGPRNTEECVFGLPKCDSENPCPLHNSWELIRKRYSEMLESTTVGDLKSRGIPSLSSGPDDPQSLSRRKT